MRTRRAGTASRRLRLVALAAACLIVACLTASSGAASAAAATSKAKTAPVPQGFVGMDLNPPAYGQDNSPNLDSELAQMVSTGVESMRVAFNWASAEPYENWSDVPSADAGQFTNVDGKPIDFTETDAFVAAASQRGVTVLPTVLYTPRWDANDPSRAVAIPKKVAPYAAYLTALVGRYGPHGSFWRENPQIRKLPIRRWQIWNEENLGYYWPQPFAKSYIALLRAAHKAVKTADPGAKVVLGALTNLAWRSIGQVYAVAGARNLFDVVSVNGFTKQPADVILYMRFMRNALDHFHAKTTPLIATEVSWPSAQGQSKQRFDFDTTRAGQARNVKALLPLIGANYKRLGLTAFYWDTWMGDEDDHSLAFNYAGLLAFRKGKVTAKPALAAFRSGALTLEGCTRKGGLATSCIK